MENKEMVVLAQPPKSKFVVLKDKFNNKLTGYGVALGVATTSGVASANPTVPDFSPIITMITGLAAVVASVGMAVLTVYATAKVFKWVKTAF